MQQFNTEAPDGTPPVPICSGTFCFYPKDVGALAAGLRGSVELAWGPEVIECGIRQFEVQDPNGDHLAFTEPAW